MASAFQDFINKYGSDKKISSGDIRAFGEAGGTQEDAENFISKAEAGKKGYEGVVGDKAYVAAGKAKNFGASTGGGVSDTGGSGGSSNLYSETDIDLGAYDAMRGIDYQYNDALLMQVLTQLLRLLIQERKCIALILNLKLLILQQEEV